MRRKEKTTIDFKRVESIERIKYSDTNRITELCEDGFVYDIEVEDNHNYFAEGILVHNCGAIPKPSERQKNIREMLINKYTRIIYLSGTPTPESYSQIYHQLNISDMYRVFEYDNFYKWAKEFVNVKQRKGANGFMYNDYSDANEKKIKAITDKYFITYSQQQSGFNSEINEVLHEVEMSELTYKLTAMLRKDKVINGKAGAILADTGVKLMNKLHQLYSGSCLLENGEAVILDRTKINYIKNTFTKKTAIFYKFKAEREMLIEGLQNVTEDIEDFKNNPDKIFIGQILSTREGVNLSTADDLVFLNIDYSATSYLQCRERAMVKDRESVCNVHFIFSKGGLEKRIYKILQQKKDYTLNYFLKDEEIFSEIKSLF